MNVQSHVIGCKTATKICVTIDKVFNTQSAVKVMFYKRQLHNIKKESQNIREYLSKITTTCDLLEAAGHKISDSEQIMTILNGLSDEYEVLVATISSQKILPSIDDVHAVLLAHEARIDNNKT